MARYQTKVRVIDAHQYKPHTYGDPEQKEIFLSHMERCSWEQGEDCIFIHHEGGNAIVEPNDWIVQVNGHYFPVPHEMFLVFFYDASNQDMLTCANDKENCFYNWGRCITLHGRRG